MFDYLALFQEYLTVELGLAKNTQLAYMRDLRLLMKSLQLKADEELLQVSRQQLIAYLVFFLLFGCVFLLLVCL